MEHISQAVAALQAHGLESAVIQSPADLLYCTGLSISTGTFLVGKETSILFLDGRYYELAKQKLSCEVVLLKQPNDLFIELKKAFSFIAGNIGFNPTLMSVAMHEKIAACCGGKHAFIAAPAYYSMLRRKKDAHEIQAITQACELCEKGLNFLLEEIRPGVTEKALASKLKAFWFEHGAQAVSFEPIIAFDCNCSIPHWSPTEVQLKEQGTILIDIGVQLDNYHSDMTRMVFFGPPDSELEKCYEIVLGAYEKAFSFAAPGVTPHHLDSIAREYITAKAYGNFFVHGLGHGVGLEVHEPPKLTYTAPSEAPLEAGDVFTLEPGIYLPGRGGVRLENTILLEPQGARSLISFSTDPILLP